MGSWPSSRRTASVWPPYLALTMVSLNLEDTEQFSPLLGRSLKDWTSAASEERRRAGEEATATTGAEERRRHRSATGTDIRAI